MRFCLALTSSRASTTRISLRARANSRVYNGCPTRCKHAGISEKKLLFRSLRKSAAGCPVLANQSPGYPKLEGAPKSRFCGGEPALSPQGNRATLRCETA